MSTTKNGWELPKTVASVQQVATPMNRNAAQIPGKQPGGNVEITAAHTANDTASAGGHTTENERAWSGGSESFNRFLETEKGTIRQEAAVPMAETEYNSWMERFGLTPEKLAGIQKETAAGTSGADETLLSDSGYGLIQGYKAEWEKLNQAEKEAEAAGDTEKAAEYRAQKSMQNVYANQVRAGAGYYGGTDGSLYIPLSQLERDQESTGGDIVDAGNAASTPEERMQGLLDAWKQAAEEQAKLTVDHAVEQAVKEYERALEDAQVQFKEQAESVSREERQAMDNAALYAELRGDQGGIGREQYSSIQNTAAQNRLAVQQAQTKLATDTMRKIEDLRVQGEFDKADLMFEITQEYLSNLMAMEQWAAQYNLSVEQFNASLKQWEADYELTLEQLGISQEQWATEMAFKEKQYDYDAYLNSLGLAHTEQSELAETGWAILKMGLVPDQRYLDAMKLDAETAAQMAAMASSVTGELMEPDQIYQMIYDAGLSGDERAAVKAYLMSMGMDPDLAAAYANAYTGSEYDKLNWSGYGKWGEGWSEEDWKSILEAVEDNLKNKRYGAFSDANMSWITEKISQEQWQELIELLKKYHFNSYDQYVD